MTRWRWAALAGIVTFSVGVGFAVPPVEPCLYTSRSPWPDLQNAFTVSRASQLLAACESSLRQGMLYDSLAFIPAFTAFLIATTWALRPARPITVAALVLLAVGVFADQVEGVLLLGIIDRGATAAAVATAAQATQIKMLFLALATVAIGIAIPQTPRGAGLVRIVVLATALLTALGVIARVNYDLSLGIAWLALALLTIVQSLRRGRQC